MDYTQMNGETMNNEQKIQIARDYAGYHKHSDALYWSPFVKFGDDKLLTIYENIIGGLYGECRLDGNEHEHEIEIRASESITGNPILFTFEADNE